MPTNLRTGMIFLHGWDDSIIRGAKYRSKWNRATHLEKWEKEIGKNFKRCYILICPNVDSDKVDHDGENSRAEKKKRKKYLSV